MSDEAVNCEANTNRELFREADDHYANSVFVTEDGKIGMNVGGRVRVRSIEDWHRMVSDSWEPPAKVVAHVDPGELLVVEVDHRDVEAMEPLLRQWHEQHPQNPIVVVPPDVKVKSFADLRRWGSAADTVAEHASEADAREYEYACTTVHRWPTGPWLADDGRIWECEDQFSELRAEIDRLQRELDRLQPRPETDSGGDVRPMPSPYGGGS